MKGSKHYIFSIIQIVIFIVSLFTDWYAFLSISLTIVVLVMILDKLGKGIVLREIIALHSTFVCLIMPVVGYQIYTRNNSLARIWVRYMAVPEDMYFTFALPASAAFVVALCWPMNKKDLSDNGIFFQEVITRIKEILHQPFMKKSSMQILAIGTTMFFVSGFLPASLQFVFLLFYFASFAGLLYLFYTPHFRRKWLILTLFILFILFNALRSGMFTIVAYMGLTLFSFFFLGKKTGFFKKTIVFVFCAFFLLLVQSIKPAYRQLVWRGYQGNQAELFIKLAADKIATGDFLSMKAFFPIYYRANQGYNIALVMRRFPNIKPHDNGRNLMLAAASALVPRFLWPDKPEAGGKFNMKYYANITLKGYSTNIGPLGEAYGSFGVPGGIIFMFFLGMFIRWAYKKLFSLSREVPLLICWIPVLFYQITYSAETDTLQILNSLIKSAFFIWLLFKFLPAWFGSRAKSEKSIYRRNQPAYEV
jgi:hypothetical protein